MFLHLSISHSVHRGVSASVHAGIHPGQTPPPWADTPLLSRPPPPMATAVDGTHPTEMHSCFAKCLPKAA